MIASICIGRGGSRGIPGKNYMNLKGHPLMAYPLMAATGSKYIDAVYFSTEDPLLANIANGYKASVLHRPRELATDTALSEDVFQHAYSYIESIAEEKIEFVVLQFANAPCCTSAMIDEMIETLRECEQEDSIATMSKLNEYSPYRMRKISDYGRMVPFLDGLDWDRISGDRDSGTDSYIYDCSCAVVKPYCITDMDSSMPPQRWLGHSILPYIQKDAACDADFPYQWGQLEYWIERNWK